MIKVFYIGLVILTLLSCSKDNTLNLEGCTDAQASNFNNLATADDGSCKFSIPYNATCNGVIGDSSFIPLIQGAAWTYSTFNGDSSFVEISGTSTIGGEVYISSVVTNGGSVIGSRNYRVEPNGDLMYIVNSNEYLEIPGNPVIGQNWTNYQGFNSEVNSLSDSIVTPFCTYYDCLRITTSSWSYLSVSYYKRGVGLVERMGRSLIKLEY